jgi:hypothetical protein
MTETKSGEPTAKLTARQQRRATALYASAHDGMALWRACGRKACRRTQACAEDRTQCGARCAPQAWAFVQHAVTALATGAPRRAAMRAAEKASPRGREKIVFRWRGGDLADVVWVRKDDGSMGVVDGPLPPTPWAVQLRRLVGHGSRWPRDTTAVHR